MPSESRMMALEPFFPWRLFSGIRARASRNAVFPHGFTWRAAATIFPASSVNPTISFTSPSAKTKSAKSSPGTRDDASVSSAARAPSIFPARPIEPEPSRRTAYETGASALPWKRS